MGIKSNELNWFKGYFSNRISIAMLLWLSFEGHTLGSVFFLFKQTTSFSYDIPIVTFASSWDQVSLSHASEDLAGID